MLSLTERWRADGLRLWFGVFEEDWILKPGDSIPAKIEEGLEHSRVLVLCMPAQAFCSEWAHLESYTYRIRDPLNRTIWVRSASGVQVRCQTGSSRKGSTAEFMLPTSCLHTGGGAYPGCTQLIRGNQCPSSSKTVWL